MTGNFSAKAARQEPTRSLNPSGPQGRAPAVVTYRATAALAVLSLLGAFAFAACGDNDDADADSGSAATTVKATEADGTISLDQTSAESGEVTFEIENTGELAHELVVLKTDLAEDDLPLLSDGSAVDEEGSGVDVVGERDDIAPGSDAELSFDNLDPGTYVLICNVPGHYGLGMHTTFTVG